MSFISRKPEKYSWTMSECPLNFRHTLSSSAYDAVPAVPTPDLAYPQRTCHHIPPCCPRLCQLADRLRRSYASRMSFYKMKVFQCETTGKGGLDYFQALHSEQTESSNLLARFPEPLKVAVLRSVQWRAYCHLAVCLFCSYYSDIRHRGKAGQSCRPGLRSLCRSIPCWREYVVIHTFPHILHANWTSNLEIFVDIQGEKCVSFLSFLIHFACSS
jgi:hypothetical protein